MRKTGLKTTMLLAMLWIVLGESGCGLATSKASEAAPGGADGFYGADAGAGDTDGDTDTDGDADGDADSGHDYPPEQEQTANYKVPQGSGRYVFIPDETHNTVVVVDSETLDIKVVKVGSRPTQLVPLTETGAVMVINLDSDEVTIIRVASMDEITKVDLPIRPDTNALAASPDGKYVIAFYDPQFAAESGPANTDQEISVLFTEPGQEKAVHMTVGMHPWRVAFNQAVTRAMVLTEEGINLIDLTQLDSIGIPPIVPLFTDQAYGPENVDVAITPDGSLAIARMDLSTQVLAVWLDGSQKRYEYVMPAEPTDLDIAEDGSYGILVLRSLNQLAFFNLPLPGSAEDSPFTYLDLGSPIVGVATIAPDGKQILLYTTTAGTTLDQQRLTLLSKTDAGWESRSVLLEKKIGSVAAGADSLTAVVIHQKGTSSSTEQPYSYSLVTIPGLQVKFQQIPESPGQLLLTPDGDFAFLLLKKAEQTEIVDLRSFIVNRLQLGSPPIAAGYAAGSDKVFIAQDHPAGRMTFIGVHDGSVKTVTGYALNDEISE